MMLGLMLASHQGESPALHPSQSIGLHWFLLAGMVVGLGVCAKGASLFLKRHQRQVGLGLLVAGVAISIGLGFWLGLWTGMLSAGACLMVMLYQWLGRYVPAAGTAIAATLVGTVLMSANPSTTHVWPVLFAMGHVTLSRALEWGLGYRRPRLSVRGFVLSVVVLLFWSLVLVSLASEGNSSDGNQVVGWSFLGGPDRFAMIGPVFAGILLWTIVGLHLLYRRSSRLLVFWRWQGLIVMDVGWLLGAGSSWAWASLVCLILSIFLAQKIVWRGCPQNRTNSNTPSNH